MTAGVPDMTHPHDEMLAAFIDGQLDDDARRRVVEHLVECAECRDIVLMADEVAVEMAEVPADADAYNVVRGRFGKRWGVPLAAAASLVVVLFLARDQLLNRAPGMPALVEAAETVEYRPTDARLNTDFEYKPARKRYRSGGDGKLPDDPSLWGVAAVTGELETRRAQSELSARNLHVLGLSYLLRNDSHKAVEILESAVKRETSTQDIRQAIAASDDVALLTDLVNAYQARATQADLLAAANVAERAWTLEKSATTAWNRAVTLEAINPSAALTAWDEYERLDSTSPWAQEIAARKASLRTRLPGSSE